MVKIQLWLKHARASCIDNGHNVRTRTRRDRACPVHTPPQWVGYTTPTPPRIVGYNTHTLPQWVSRHSLVTWWTGPGAALCKRSSHTTLYGNQPGVCTATQRCGRLPGSRHPAEIRTPDKSVFGPGKLGHFIVKGLWCSNLFGLITGSTKFCKAVPCNLVNKTPLAVE